MNTMPNNTLRTELAADLMKLANVDEIIASEPLIGDGLGLDSVDVMNLIILLEEKYGIKFQHISETKAIFTSFDRLLEYVQEHHDGKI